MIKHVFLLYILNSYNCRKGCKYNAQNFMLMKRNRRRRWVLSRLIIMINLWIWRSCKCLEKWDTSIWSCWFYKENDVWLLTVFGWGIHSFHSFHSYLRYAISSMCLQILDKKLLNISACTYDYGTYDFLCIYALFCFWSLSII